jgi:hypothetical protein
MYRPHVMKCAVMVTALATVYLACVISTRAQGRLLAPLAPADAKILHAGGTVTLSLPRDWTVRETPLGRDIYLLLGPGELEASPQSLERGLWLRQRSRLGTGANHDPVELIEVHLAEDPQTTAVGRIRKFEVGGAPAARQAIALKPSAPPARAAEGVYLAMVTEWSIVGFSARGRPMRVEILGRKSMR